MISKTSFRRPEVGLYLRFFRAAGPLFRGCADMMEGMIPDSTPECGGAPAPIHRGKSAEWGGCQ